MSHEPCFPARRGLLLLVLAFAWTSASASTITVNTTQDSSNTGLCSLRDAIDNANDNAQTHAGCARGDGADTIVFDPMVFATPQTIFLGSTLPNLKDSATTTIDGGGMVTLDGQNLYAILTVGLFVTDVSAELRRLTLRHGNANNAAANQYYGGAVYSAGTLVARNVTFDSNNAAWGGGALFTATSTTSLIDCTFAGNTVSTGSGSAIYNQGPLTISGSTFSDNSNGSYGAALFQGLGDTTIANSTFSGNRSYDGPAIRVNGGSLSLSSSTIAGNTATGFGGALSISGDAGPVTLAGSLVADNSGGNCNGPIGDGGGNLYWPASAPNCPGAAGNPNLGALADNGGPTRTLLPGAGAAIDAIPASGGQCAATTDQRGTLRPQGAGCDVGAVEVVTGMSHTVSAIAPDGHGAITPASQSVPSGETASFTVTPHAGFAVQDVVGDTCAVTRQGASDTWTTDAIVQGCAVTATFTEPPSRCSATTGYDTWFLDDFPGTALDAAKWTAYDNGGTIAVANHGVSIASALSAFPFVTSAGSPIPPSGSFSVRWIARYTAASNAGDGTLVLSKGLPPNGLYDNDLSLRRAEAWQSAGEGFTVRMRSQDAGEYGTYFTDAAATPHAMHEVEYCWLDSARAVEIWIDGVRKARASNATLSRPDSLWFGNPNYTGTGWRWNPFQLYHVEVRAIDDDGLFSDGFD